LLFVHYSLFLHGYRVFGTAGPLNMHFQVAIEQGFQEFIRSSGLDTGKGNAGLGPFQNDLKVLDCFLGKVVQDSPVGAKDPDVGR